jgi:hypothetical protein
MNQAQIALQKVRKLWSNTYRETIMSEEPLHFGKRGSSRAMPVVADFSTAAKITLWEDYINTLEEDES